MRDIGIFFKNGCFDLEIENNNLKADDGLRTAILISLFTNERVTKSELPQLRFDRMGWWGDLISEIEGDKIGSKLWTVLRDKVTFPTRERIKETIQESLNWLVVDGVAESVEADAEIVAIDQINFSASITKITGEDSRFDAVWNAEALKFESMGLN